MLSLRAKAASRIFCTSRSKDAVVLTNKIEAGRVWDEEVSQTSASSVSIWQGALVRGRPVIENEVLRRVGTGSAGRATSGIRRQHERLGRGFHCA